MDMQQQAVSASDAETGHNKNADNFYLLLAAVQRMGSSYQPSNPLITVTALSSKALHVVQAISHLHIATHEAAEAQNRRTALFFKINPFAARIYSTLQSSQHVPPIMLQHARAILKKISGRRASGKTTVLPTKAVAVMNDAGVRAVSQLSFDQRLAHFISLRNLVFSQHAYEPTGQDVGYSAILKFEDDLLEANHAVGLSNNKLVDARNLRYTELYDKTTGAVTVAALVKNYLKGKLSNSHPDYIKIKGLAFRRW